LSFNELAEPLWTSTGFFDDLQGCLAASLELQPWPPESNIYHRPWKLLKSCLRLALAGHSQQLLQVVPPLVACVLRRLPQGDGLVAAEDARIARLAVPVLLAMADQEEALHAMRTFSPLPGALRQLIVEEPAAAELLEALALEPRAADIHVTEMGVETRTAPVALVA